MNLFKTSLLSSISASVGFITSLTLNKLLATYIGSAGFAVLGQFQNVMTLVLMFAGGAFKNGIVKYSAEYSDNEEAQQTVWQTAIMSSLLFALFLSICLAIFSSQLSQALFHSHEYSSVLIWLAFFLIPTSFNALLPSILNGKKEIKLLVTVNIVTAIVHLAVTGYLASQLGIYGALVALSFSQALAFLLNVFICRHCIWLRFQSFFGRIDPKTLKLLGGFALMALSTAVIVPVTQVIVREHLISQFGWSSAGMWEATSRMSNIYLMLVTSTLGVYYLPKLSEISSTDELKREILFGYKWILPGAIFITLTIFFSRSWLIDLLFTKEFQPVKDLLAWQLAGDVLKIGSWLLAYVMVSKALTKIYIITEIGYALTYITLVHMLTEHMGLEGAIAAYCICYGLYWAAMIGLIGGKIKNGYDFSITQPKRN